MSDMENTENVGLVHCLPMSACISHKWCVNYQLMAERAAKLILAGMKLTSIGRIEVDRLTRCGRCSNKGMELSLIDLGEVFNLITAEIRSGFERIDKMVWDEKDPDVIQVNVVARRARYLDNHREKRKEYMKERRRKLKELGIKSFANIQDQWSESIWVEKSGRWWWRDVRVDPTSREWGPFMYREDAIRHLVEMDEKRKLNRAIMEADMEIGVGPIIDVD